MNGARALSIVGMPLWYIKRFLRMLWVTPPAIARCALFLIVEAWNEKTAVSIYALNGMEENAARHAREELARYIGKERVSPEEYLVICARLVDTFTNGRLEPLTKTEASRLIDGRRRYRPVK